MTALRTIAIAATALLVATALSTHLAFAHARYKSSAPNAGEVVQTSPAQVEITFTQEIQKVSGTYGMTVTDRNNSVVSSGPAVIDEQDRTKMSVPLGSDLPPGRYVVNWKNVSDADGHDLAGAFAFYVGVQPTAADLEADKVLAAIGAPSLTPAGSDTAAAGSTAAVIGRGTASPAATTGTSVGSSAGGSTGLFVLLGVLGALIIAGGGAWLYVRGRRM